MHSANSWQECKLAAHSLISAQLNLSTRRNPGKQLHTYDPIVFSHTVFKWQWLPNWPPCCAHSSMSEMENWIVKSKQIMQLHVADPNNFTSLNWLAQLKLTCTIKAIPLEAGTTGTRIFCIKIKTRSVYVTSMTFSAIVISCCLFSFVHSHRLFNLFFVISIRFDSYRIVFV